MALYKDRKTPGSRRGWGVPGLFVRGVSWSERAFVVVVKGLQEILLTTSRDSFCGPVGIRHHVAIASSYAAYACTAPSGLCSLLPELPNPEVKVIEVQGRMMSNTSGINQTKCSPVFWVIDRIYGFCNVAC